MKPAKSGKPSKKSESGFNWAKIVIVMVCILFAGIMIMSTLGTNWLVTMKPAANGDVAYIDLTMKDQFDRPVFTTNQRIYNATLTQGSFIAIAAPFGAPVNITTQNLIDPMTVFMPGSGQVSFAFLGPEYNQITAGLVGMKEGETKTIYFVDEPQYRRNMTPEEFAQMGGNFSEAKKGDQMVLGFTTSPMISADSNTTPQYAMRIVPIIEKSGDNLMMDYGYSSADITVLRLSRGGSGSS
jgi:hypothetical protein